MSEITVSRPRPHPAQDKILKEKSRFNVVCNGRRWGKTVLGVYLAQQTILEGYPVGFFVPTFDFAEEPWEELKERLEPIITYKNEAKFVMRFSTGGSIKFWSLEKKRSGRGRKYKRVIVDEAAFAKDLEESWKRAIRPTLTDLLGDAWFLSTPQGAHNFFCTLFNNSKEFDNWKSWQMPTSTNPGISEDELKEIEAQLDSLTFSQEFGAEFVNFKGRNFAYSFKQEKNVSEKAEYNPDLITFLSFDFNVDPATCGIFQFTADYVYMVDEFHLESSDIYQLLDQIKASRYYNNNLRVTGDASGYNREKATYGLMNMYDIIEKELRLPILSIETPSANPSIRFTRVLLNSLLERHKSFLFNPRCKHTIKDLQFVQVNEKGEIDKSDDRLTHHLDTVRYFCASFLCNFIQMDVE
jgi:hypothetical protein